MDIRKDRMAFAMKVNQVLIDVHRHGAWTYTRYLEYFVPRQPNLYGICSRSAYKWIIRLESVA